jgi:hypothetical protein
MKTAFRCSPYELISILIKKHEQIVFTRTLLSYFDCQWNEYQRYPPIHEEDSSVHDCTCGRND